MRAGRWPLAITLMAALAACSDVPTATRPMDEPRATREVQPTWEEGTAVYFGIHDTADIDRETGEIHVAGVVRCSAPATFDIGVELVKEEKPDGLKVLESITLPEFQCTVGYKTWNVVFQSTKELHQNGTAIVNVYTGKPKSPISPADLAEPVKLVRESR